MCLVVDSGDLRLALACDSANNQKPPSSFFNSATASNFKKPEYSDGGRESSRSHVTDEVRYVCLILSSSAASAPIIQRRRALGGAFQDILNVEADFF